MLTLIGLVAAVSGQAATAAPAAAPVERLICKRVEEDTTGSRLGKTRRICRTQAEWRSLDDATSRVINKTKGIGLTDPYSLPQGR